MSALTNSAVKYMKPKVTYGLQAERQGDAVNRGPGLSTAFSSSQILCCCSAPKVFAGNVLIPLNLQRCASEFSVQSSEIGSVAGQVLSRSHLLRRRECSTHRKAPLCCSRARSFSAAQSTGQMLKVFVRNRFLTT